MPRQLASLLLTAAVVSAAAVGVEGFEQVSASADDALTSGQPAAAALEDGAATTGLEPRSVAPSRRADVVPARDPDAPPPRQLDGTGELLPAAGTSRDPVDRGGRTVRFSVEVEVATGLDPEDVAAVVEEALYDERSWARDHDLRRVAPREAELHVVIATPDSVDALCRRAGLRTLGWLSCWTRDTAAINLIRWNQGVSHFDDLGQYQRYVVNHEVGHGLGYGHRGCPGRGVRAPLMQQQTKSMHGCLPNEWQHADR